MTGWFYKVIRKGRQGSIHPGLTACLLGLMMFFAGPLAAQHQSTPYAMQLRLMIEQDLTRIATGFDPDAIVYVSLNEAPPVRTELPATPFALEAVTLEASTGLPKFQSCEVLLFTKLETIGTTMRQTMEEIVGRYNMTPKIAIRKLAPEFRSPSSQKAEGSIQGQQNPDELTAAGKLAASIETIGAGAMDASQKMLLTVITAAGSALLLLVIALVVFGKRLTALSGGLSGIMGALQEGMDGGRPARSAAASPQNPGQVSTPIQTQNQENLESVPVPALIAMFADCYWCEKDGQAAWLWNRITTGQRLQILSGLSFMRSYAGWLVDTGEETCTSSRDPYYLSPLPLNHLDNPALTEVVRNHPSLIHALPRMRALELTLSPLERIAFEKSDSADLPTINFEAFPASVERTLQVHKTYAVSSVSDEDSLLAMADDDIDAAYRFETLVWSVSLPDDRLAGILRRFSATELAEAWVGPQSVLERLEKLLPARKQKFLTNYREQITASRKSASYQALYRAIASELRALHAETAPGESIADEPAVEAVDTGNSAA